MIMELLRIIKKLIDPKNKCSECNSTEDLQDGKITLEKIRGHLQTVCAHKRQVMKHCFAVGLYYQGIMHDMSKFSPTEFINGCRYYQGGKQSPNNGERNDKGYSAAWMHHKGRNRHHYEYWNDYRTRQEEGKFPVKPVKMPRRYVAEMLCDRMAASKTYLKKDYNQHAPLDYYLKGKGMLLMDPQTAKELEYMLRLLDEKGEKVLFRFVRKEYLKGRPIQ